MTFLVYSTQIAKSYCWVKYTPKFEKWWSNMHRCMWLAYPEGFNSIEYSVILHWTIMSHSDFSENLSPIGFLGDLDWWFCICTAYRHLLIFRIDNVIIVRIRIWISDWYWLWANLNTHLLKKSLLLLWMVDDIFFCRFGVLKLHPIMTRLQFGLVYWLIIRCLQHPRQPVVHSWN